MPSVDPQTHLYDFRRKFDNLPSKAGLPNWMVITFSEELRVHPPVSVTVDYRSDARKALDVLVHHLWESCENWTVVIKRP